MTSILPPNASRVEQAVEVLALHVRDLDVPIRHLWNPQTCPSAFLPWLAWAWSVDTWRSDWPEATKRAVIAASPRVHRLKGTAAAVKAAVQAVAGTSSVEVVEWFQPGGSGEPYTARVWADITQAAGGYNARSELARELIAAAEASAPMRVQLEVGLKARPVSHLQAASRLRPPVVRAVHCGDARYTPRLPTGLIAASHIRKPLTLGRISMDGAIVRPMAVAHQIAAHIRTPATVARVYASGA